MNTVLQLSVTFDERVGVITCAGEVDSYNELPLREAVHRLLDGGCTRLILDLTDVRYMDSSGIKILIESFQRHHDKEGSVELVGCSPMVRRLLTVTCLERYFRYWEHLADARWDRKTAQWFNTDLSASSGNNLD